MKLYSYFRSSASYRVRIALNLKGLAYDTVPVHLLKKGGEQFSDEYRQLNPTALIPTLVDDTLQHAAVITQSLAIIEYLDEAYPTPSLLPASPIDRAYVRSIGLSIACEIHPLNNLRVLRYLKNELKVDEEEKDAWYRHWCEQGLIAVETVLEQSGQVGKFCYGDSATLADCLLIPQVFNAQRFNCDLTKIPNIMRINDHCNTLDAFIKAAPDKQLDHE